MAERQEERLAKIMENYDELVAQEELKEKLLVSLDEDVFLHDFKQSGNYAERIDKKF